MLSRQNANVVLYQRTPFGKVLSSEIMRDGKAMGFRRGTMPVMVPNEFVIHLLQSNSIDKEILFSLHSPQVTTGLLKEAFSIASERDISIPEAFAQCGLSASDNFVKGLFISAYGSIWGLRVIDPQASVENLSHSLLRNNFFADCRVYNPNLGSLEGLYHILDTEKFDFVGFSPVILEEDVKIMAEVNRRSPDALKIAGGFRLETIPPRIFLKSFPIDVAVAKGGESTLLEIAKKLHEAGSREAALDKLSEIFGVHVYNNGDIVSSKARHVAKAVNTFMQMEDDIPLKREDVYHPSTYERKRGKTGILLGDHIGFKPIVIMIADHCRGKCVFCFSPKNRLHLSKKVLAESIPEVVEGIKRRWETGRYDSIQILDNNFTTHREVVEEFCVEIKRRGLEFIPKSCKGKVDEMCVSRKSNDADEQLLTLLAEAGFKRIYYGIESFNQKSLDSMKKETSVEQNENVLQTTIDAGIIPGINVILFGGMDETPEDVLHTVERVLYFVRQGATVNSSEFMDVEFGAPGMRLFPERIIYSVLDVPGMRAPYKRPGYIYTNSDHHSFAFKVEKSRREFLDFIKNQYPFITFPVHINSLAMFWAAANLLEKHDLAEEIKSLIDTFICGQTGTIQPHHE